MPRYISKYVPIDFAIKRIAEQHFGGNEAAAWADVTLAIKEGAITKRPVDDLRTKRHPPDDMLSNIVARTVMAKGNQPVGEDNQELKNWPKGTWLRRELEEIHRQIFTEDDGASTPDEQDEARQPDGEQLPTKAEPVELPEHAQPERRPSPVTQPRLDYWRKRETEIRNKNRHFSLLQIAKKIATEGAPDHLTDDQKEDWKKKGWTTENIHRRLKDRP